MTPEGKVQAAIIKRLESKGYYMVKYIQTTKNGWPDLGAHKNRRLIYIEVKRLGEEAEPLQLHRHKELRQQGFEVIVADKIEDIQHL